MQPCNLQPAQCGIFAPTSNRRSDSRAPLLVLPVIAMPTLLKLPAFLFSVWVMYWSLPLGSLFMYIKVWKLWGPRNDVYQW